MVLPLSNWIFYHDVDDIFWPQPTRSLKLGHVTGQGSMSPTWVGRVSDPGKMAFIISIKLWYYGCIFDCVFKIKVKNKQIKNMNNRIRYGNCFLSVLEGNLQWNCWIVKKIDYLRGSTVEFKLNFEKAVETKSESVWWWQISSKTRVFRTRLFIHCKSFVFSKYHLIKTFLLIFISFPRMIIAILLPILIKCTVRI